MPAFSRLEVWTNLQCAGGTRVAVVRDPVSVEPVYDLTGDEQLTVRVMRTSAAYSDIVEKRVMRVYRKDGTWDEWRVSGRTEQSGYAGGSATVVTCRPVVFDLGDIIIKETINTGKTLYSGSFSALSLAEAFDSVIKPALVAAGITWWDRGTFDSTAFFDWSYEDATALSLLRNWAEKFQLELAVRPNGTSGYLVDLVTEIGVTAPTPYVTTRKNLETSQRTVATNEQATRVIPRGSPGGGPDKSDMGPARWKVSSVVGGDIVLADELGVVVPIAFDDQLNGWYVFHEGAGTTHLITDTTKATQQVTLSGGTGAFAAGDLVTLRLPDGITPPTALDAPIEVQPTPVGYGVIERFLDRMDLYGATNLVPNPFMRSWAGSTLAPPGGWSVGGAATVAQDTDPANTDYGGQSSLVNFGTDGVYKSPQFRVWTQGVASRATVSLRVRVKFQTFTGDCYVGFLLHSTGGALIDSPVLMKLYPADHPTAPVADRVAVDTWYDVIITAIDISLLDLSNPVELHTFIQQGGAGGSCAAWIDAVQVTQTDHDVGTYIEASAAVELWDVGNRYLTAFRAPVIEYQVELRDLERLDGSPWTADKLVLGGKMILQDTQLGITATPRVIRYAPNELEPLSSRVLLSNRLKSLTQLLQLLGGIGSTRVSGKSQSTVLSPTTPSTTGTGGTGTTPQVIQPGILHVPFFAAEDAEDELVLSNIPVLEAEIRQELRKRIPLSGYASCRLMGYVTQAAAVVGAALKLGYTLNGVLVVPLTKPLPVDVLGNVESDWEDMPVQMLIDVIITAMMLGGANIAGAKLASLAAQFSTLSQTSVAQVGTGVPASIVIAPAPLSLMLPAYVCNSALSQATGLRPQYYGENWCAYSDIATQQAAMAVLAAQNPNDGYELGFEFFDNDVQDYGLPTGYTFNKQGSFNGGHFALKSFYPAGYQGNAAGEGPKNFWVYVWQNFGPNPDSTTGKFANTFWRENAAASGNPITYGPTKATARVVVEFSSNFVMDPDAAFINFMRIFALQSSGGLFGQTQGWFEGDMILQASVNGAADGLMHLYLFSDGAAVEASSGDSNIELGTMASFGLLDGQPHEIIMICDRGIFQDGSRNVTVKIDGVTVYNAIWASAYANGDPRQEMYFPDEVLFMESEGPSYSFGTFTVPADQYYQVYELEYITVGMPSSP